MSSTGPRAEDRPEGGERPRADRLMDLVRIDHRRAADKLLILLLVADATLIVGHLLHAFTPLLGGLDFSISTERGFGETFQYLKEGGVAVVLVILAAGRRRLHYACWAIVIGLLFWDDFVRFREIQGRVVAERLDLPGPVRPASARSR